MKTFAALLTTSFALGLAASVRAERPELPNARTLFEGDATSVTFRLRGDDQKEDISPERVLLHRNPNQQAIAEMLKEERNKKLQPGLTPPDDKNTAGIKVRFDGIRFLKDPKNPDNLRVRLIGPVNEVENKTPLSMRQLLESTEPIPIRFESVTHSTGVTVTITTDAKIKLENDQLIVSDTSGTFDFSVGRFSPARLLYASDRDSVSLPTLVGRRVTDKEFPIRSLLDPENL